MLLILANAALLFVPLTIITPFTHGQDPGSTASESAEPEAADETVQTMFPHFKEGRLWISGQANFIFQTHPPFYAKYSGPNSLQPGYEKATSRVLTLYTGSSSRNQLKFCSMSKKLGARG